MKTNHNLKLAVAAILVTLASLATTFAQGPPTEISDSFVLEDVCPFPVQIDVIGKEKVNVLPWGLLIASPDLTTRLTNLDDPSKQQMLGITGAFQLTFADNGDVKFVVTGRNLLAGFDPSVPLVLSIGRFSFTFDDEGNLVEPVMGKGQLINLCSLLQ